ncbi:MAG: gliding motility-associated C-terminal domain-containing protein [Bacteroidetes bacterium]|nr:gliding motility-associated C-terminal domain-containing protein [Bacteroidota bacterium]
MMKKLLFTLTILVTCLLEKAYSQDGSYIMTASTKTITSCRATLDVELACTRGAFLTPVYCANIDRAYTFVSGSGTVLNANLTLHVLDDDFIYVYDGPSAASPLIATWTGGNTTTCFTGLNATSTGSVITIRFVSNGSKGQFLGSFPNEVYGWSILIGCPPTSCNGNIPAADNCSSSPQICNLAGYCGNTGGWYNEDNAQLEGQAAPGFGGSIENNSWINFVSSATTSTLVVQSANCLFTGSGIQGAVYASTNCSTFTPVSGGNFNQTTAAGTVTLSLTGLTAGQDYYLMLDGYGGNVCDYTVTAKGNVQTLNTTSSATSNTICPNQTFTVTATAGATSYAWSPAPVSTSSNTAVFNNISSTSVITTTAFGYCGASATVALTMSVVPLSISVNSPTICSGGSTILTASGASTYSWSGAGLSSTTGSTVSVNPTSLTVYTVTGTSGLCSDTKTSTVTVSSLPVITVNSPTICLGSSAVLTANGGTIYSWSPGTNLSGTSGSTVSANPTSTAFYTVTGTANGCSSTNVSTVTVNAIPSTTASNSGVLTCSTLSVALNSTLAGVNYTWTAPSGGSVLSANSQTTEASGAAGIYSLVVQSAAGCTYSTTTSVTQNTVVPVTVAGVTGSVTCVTNTVNLNSSLSGMNYTWTAPSTGNISSGVNSQNAIGSGIGIYSLTVIDPSNGCSYATTASVTDNTITPTGVSAGSNQTLTCSSSSVSLTGSVSTPGNATFSWDSGVCGSTTNAVTSACAAGVYTLTATDPSNGCIATSTVEVFPNSGAPTATISSTALILDCNSPVQSVTVSSTPNTNVIYSWNNSPASTSPDGSGASFNTANTYICTVTNTISNCSTPVQVVVTTNTAVPTTTATSSGALTCVTTTVALNSTLTGMNYTWTAPAGGSVTSPNTESTNASGAGDYSLTVVDPANGCSFTTSVTVTQNTVAPVGLSAGNNQTLSCNSTSVTLTGSITSPSNASYIWSGPAVCGTPTLITTDACAAGVYTLVATDPSNGCSAVSSVQLFPNSGAPLASITSTALVIDCNNASPSATVTSVPNSDVTYTWNNTPATLSANGSIVSFNTANTYICTVTNTLTNCSANVQVVVSTNTAVPVVNISPNQTLTCANSTAVLSTTVTVSSGASASYNWTGSGIVSGQGTGTVTVNQGGSYGVTVTDNSNGCSTTTPVQVTSGAIPPTVSISAATSNSLITCQNHTVSLNATPNPSGPVYSYTWSTGGNNSTETVTSANSYTVLVLDAVTGCTAVSVPYTVGTNTTAPGVSSTNMVIPCGSPSVTLNATSGTGNVSYGWTTSGTGTLLSGANTASPLAGSVGPYVVTATDNNNGCSSTTTINVTTTSINAAFTANPTSGTAPLLVNFSNQTAGTGNIYSWNFGDDNNNTSSLTNPDHTYNATGNYVVTLLVTDASGLCSSTATLSIEVFDNSALIIPNVFTPNGDGKNDVFKITSTGMKDLNCDIFNRWGTKVFSITSVSGVWDGGNSNDGTYFYVITCTGLDGKEYKQQGYLNLFR